MNIISGSALALETIGPALSHWNGRKQPKS